MMKNKRTKISRTSTAGIRMATLLLDRTFKDSLSVVQFYRIKDLEYACKRFPKKVPVATIPTIEQMFQNIFLPFVSCWPQDSINRKDTTNKILQRAYTHITARLVQ